MDFKDILNNFIKEFEVDEIQEHNLRFIYNVRNIISHSYISLYKDYLLYKPSSRSKKGALKKYHRLKKELKLEKRKDSSKNFIISMNLSNDDNFNKIIEIIEKIDDIYLRDISKTLGVDYEKLR